ncbi:Tetratricopeptide repeat-containing protein [Marivirga sericea]|uniref:Tetratricopeptide repeat-containing protein n=1 Tax=Marivirga sericea TaxID=1028 RepID=A0A1X7ISP2_9BACT|nr:tetratricopeptide repeat protein [Marivirga sericea]SMG17867.1 Tetratricopeptide repeat-containing protein [Marivirga sericea]
MKKLFIINLCFFILIACTNHKEKGSQLFESGDYNHALGHFEEVLKLDPRNEMMLYNAARCYEELGQYSEAINLYDRSIDNQKDLTIAYLGRGRSYFKAGDYKSSVVDFTNALYYDETNEDALYYGALSFMKDSLYGKARKVFTTLLELNPDHYKARFNRGVLYAIQANTLFALSDFNNLIRNKKLLPNAHFNRGIVYQYMNNYDGAIYDFTKAINLGYYNEEVLTKRANCYLATSQKQNACKDFEKLSKFSHQKAKELMIKYCDQYSL